SVLAYAAALVKAHNALVVFVRAGTCEHRTLCTKDNPPVPRKKPKIVVSASDHNRSTFTGGTNGPDGKNIGANLGLESLHPEAPPVDHRRCHQLPRRVAVDPWSTFAVSVRVAGRLIGGEALGRGRWRRLCSNLRST
ncbi:unnamed protein product, partial [Ectocarpus sp. 12 AP-2014]